MVWHFIELIGAYALKNWFVPALEVNFLEKLPQLVAFRIFQSSYLMHGECLYRNMLSNYYKPHSKHSFGNITYIANKTPKLVAKILASNFGFVPDC